MPTILSAAMNRPTLIVVPALLAGTLAAAVAWWLGPWSTPGPESARGTAGAERGAGRPAAAEHSAGAGAAAASAPVPTPVEKTGSASTERSLPAATREPEVPGIQPVADPHLSPALSGANWGFDDYHSATARPDSVGPETAYAAFEFLKSCIGVPHDEADFEMRVEQYDILAEQNRRRVSEERFERIMEDLQSGYLRCAGLEDTDLIASAVEWLQLAADLGHLRAQLGFYRELPELLRRAPGRLYREPHYLDLHREKSIDYLDRALASGHPQAFRAMAEAILDDVLFEPDLIAAYAHLYAGDLAAAGALPEIGEQLVWLESRMTGGDLRYAREWGRQLCRQWCQRDDQTDYP